MKKRLICLALVLCLSASLGCSAFAAKDYSAYVCEVVLQEGDTLLTVCDSMNMDYYKILNAIKIVNGLTDASSLDAVKVGQKILLPKSEADAVTVVSLHDAVISAIIPANYVCKYTVKADDTVYGICRALNLTYSACKDAIISINGWSGGKDLTTIYVGQEILLPVSDSAAKEISATVAKAVDMNINVSTALDDAFEFYIVEYTLSSGESIKDAVTELGIEFTADIEAKVKAINGIDNLAKVQAGKKYLLPSLSADNVKYAVYSHKVVSGETSADLCKTFGAEYEKEKDFISALNTEASFPSIKIGQTVLLAAPRGGDEGKTPVIIK